MRYYRVLEVYKGHFVAEQIQHLLKWSWLNIRTDNLALTKLLSICIHIHIYCTYQQWQGMEYPDWQILKFWIWQQTKLDVGNFSVHVSIPMWDDHCQKLIGRRNKSLDQFKNWPTGGTLCSEFCFAYISHPVDGHWGWKKYNISWFLRKCPSSGEILI